MEKSKSFILEEHLDKMTEKPYCILCRGDIQQVALTARGAIEFYDGWFWICPKCRLLVPTFDQTQCEPWSQSDIPPYRASSRKRWLRWFAEEFYIHIPEVQQN